MTPRCLAILIPATFLVCDLFADQIISQVAPSIYTNKGNTNEAVSGFTPTNLSTIFTSKSQSPLTTTNAVVSFVFKSTAIAPRGAAGSGQLNGNHLSMHLTQLAPGSYQLQLIHRGDGAAQKVGALTIVDPTAAPDRQATDNKREASAAPDQVRVDTDLQVRLPPGMAAENIGKLELLDTSGNAVLVAETHSG
ncbi:MAG TPA: hypothetical protein VKY92_06455 [Verrucomicrobiae bacterium]|nr:hypothetical protein [Verrucomicrobiae bacterium]